MSGNQSNSVPELDRRCLRYCDDYGLGPVHMSPAGQGLPGFRDVVSHLNPL